MTVEPKTTRRRKKAISVGPCAPVASVICTMSAALLKRPLFARIQSSTADRGAKLFFVAIRFLLGWQRRRQRLGWRRREQRHLAHCWGHRRGRVDWGGDVRHFCACADPCACRATPRHIACRCARHPVGAGRLLTLGCNHTVRTWPGIHTHTHVHSYFAHAKGHFAKGGSGDNDNGDVAPFSMSFTNRNFDRPAGLSG